MASFVDAATLGHLLGGVSAWTLKAWARRTVDGLPSYKAGRRLVFDPVEAETWFRETQRRLPTVPTPRRRARRPRRVRQEVDQ
jgi:hypothetical protein